MLIYLQMIDSPEDRSKFERLYLEYRGLMFHVANEILHNEQDAEYAVHQSFLKVAENMEKIGDPISPRTQGYLVTIAENRAIDLYRRRKIRSTVDLIEELPGIPAVCEGENVLAVCILKLPARYREAILLRYFHGYSAKETAALLGLSVAAATKLIQRAKNKLKELYEKEETL